MAKVNNNRYGTLRTKKTTWPIVTKWIETQNDLNDAILFLIEKEICKNGVRDLSTFIPKVRKVEYFMGDSGNTLNDITSMAECSKEIVIESASVELTATVDESIEVDSTKNENVQEIIDTESNNNSSEQTEPKNENENGAQVFPVCYDP